MTSAFSPGGTTRIVTRTPSPQRPESPFTLNAGGWCRLLGLYDCDDLKDAEPDTLRYQLWPLPARLACHARARALKISRTWPRKDAFLTCWQRLCALPAPA